MACEFEVHASALSIAVRIDPNVRHGNPFPDHLDPACRPTRVSNRGNFGLHRASRDRERAFQFAVEHDAEVSAALACDIRGRFYRAVEAAS